LRERFKENFIHETPAPILAPFERLHDRVASLVEMFGRMPIDRRIAAANLSAITAPAQVDPRIAHFQAFFAAFGVWTKLSYLFDMCAFFHKNLLT
jgi:hypothetical protein